MPTFCLKNLKIFSLKNINKVFVLNSVSELSFFSLDRSYCLNNDNGGDNSDPKVAQNSNDNTKNTDNS